MAWQRLLSVFPPACALVALVSWRRLYQGERDHVAERNQHGGVDRLKRRQRVRRQHAGLGAKRFAGVNQLGHAFQRHGFRHQRNWRACKLQLHRHAFDTNVLGDAVTITGNSAPFTTGAAYTFNPITQADSYQLKVSTGSTATWARRRGGLASPKDSATDDRYEHALRQTSVKRTGAKAFQLAFPDWNNQSFQVTRDIIPSATSQLQFYDVGRFATTTTTLSAEISTDSGNTWTSVWSRNGVGLNSAYWDPAFISRSVSLAAYAGHVIRIRFILRWNGQSAVISTTSSDGFFIDDITVTNATQLVNPTTTSLAGVRPRSHSTPQPPAQHWWRALPIT